MTVTRERRGEVADDDEDYSDDVAWNDRALFGSFKGLPWWAAVLIAFVLAIIGTFIDVNSTKTVGWVFSVLFFVGCVGAVVFVERRSMFGPVVQPPLILAIVVPLVVVVTQGLPATGGLSSLALTLGRPLINGFPTMAITTICTVLVGLARVFRQRDPNRVTREEAREVKKADRAERPSRPVAKPTPEKARPERSREERPREDTGPRRRPVAADSKRASPPAESKRAAVPPDEERRARPRPAQGERRRPATPPADRPSSPRQARGDRPVPPRRPRPRDDD